MYFPANENINYAIGSIRIEVEATKEMLSGVSTMSILEVDWKLYAKLLSGIFRSKYDVQPY